MAIIFVFLDGVGLGRPDEANPFWRHEAPFLRRLLGAPLAQPLSVRQGHVLALGIDATLGVPGVPQSATGQTALFTGVNAPALMGEHLTAYPNGRLRAVIAEHSLLKRAVEGGHRATFANAYTDAFWHTAENGRRRLSATTLTTMAAGLPFRTFQDLWEERAVYWDFTHSLFRRYHGIRRAYRRPEEAGRILASLAHEHDLVLFESFLPDMIGHGRLPHTPRWLVYALDAFLGGAIEAMRPQDTLVLSSDHGNFEDGITRTHTRNPVPLLVVGPAAPSFASVQDITGVAPAILQALGSDGTEKPYPASE